LFSAPSGLKPNLTTATDRGIVGGQVFDIAIIKEHIGTERILKPSPSLNRLQNFAFISLHFRMFFANMRPTFIGQINLVSKRIRYRAKHLGQLIHAVCRESHCDASLNGKTLYRYVAIFNKSWAEPASFNTSIIGCGSFPSQGTGQWRTNHRRKSMYQDRQANRDYDLPIEQPTKFELVINLKTAKQIGLTIPQKVLARADKVIR